MKLQSIELEAFGSLTELTLADLDPGLNVLYGSNGSGKTTLLQFVRGIFCGFAEARRIGLLPPAEGRIGSGSLQVRWDGDVCRFSRSDDRGVENPLRAVLVRNDLHTPHPRFQPGQLRADLVPLLYTAGNTDAHALSSLIEQARRDGIQLVGRQEVHQSLKRAAAAIRDERFALLHSSTGEDAGVIADLTVRRDRLEVERDHLIETLRERVRQWDGSRSRRPQGDVLHWHHRVTWLRNELAAAECDLREAQDRRWMPPTIVPEVAPAQRHTPRVPDHPHLDQQRILRLQRVDRRIEHARTLLAEAARARLEISLRLARMAGSDDTAAGPFLEQIRESLKSLEASVLDLRDDAEQLAGRPQSGCVCREWKSTAQEAVAELTRRVYGLCEQVSRYELQHQKSLLARALGTIRRAELDLLRHLESLRTQRLALLGTADAPLAWKGRSQAVVEQDHCECLEHEARQQWRLVRPTAPVEAAPQPILRKTPRRIARPTPERLEQLQRRVEHLRRNLDAAVTSWRQARNWQPQPLPTEISTLEQQLDQVRLDLDAVDSQLSAAQQRWRVLSLAGEAIRRMIDKQEREQRPTVIQWASSYLRQLTQGQHVEIVVAEDGALQVVAADGSTQPRELLSRGTRDQLALSLRLALVRAYRSRGVSFPLLLDDVLTDTDQPRLRAAVDLLQQVAAQQSQQIIYLTCQSHLAELFAQQQVSVRVLPASSPLRRVAPADEGESATMLRGWVDRPAGAVSEAREELTADGGMGAAAEARPRRTAAPRRLRLLKPLHRRQPDGRYWLSMDAPVSLVPSIGSQMGRRLTGLGVRTAGELIDLDTSSISLRLRSLQIAPEHLAQWQSEAMLLCCVPDLTGPDAQLLSRAGIAEADQLAEAMVEDLLQAIEAQEGSQTVQEALLTRDVVQRWIQNARRARPLAQARRLARRRAAASGPGGDSRGGRTKLRTGTSAPGGPAGRRPQVENNRRRLRRDRQAAPLTGSGRARRRQPEVPAGAVVPLRARGEETRQQQPWRFFLSLQSPVVDAPSIGPTTANHLSRIGVITVADLVNRPAAEIALRLNNRRIREQTVLHWQQQSRLMCRIPLLRGHDAQVLVACGITEPEQVANTTPDALFAVIDPFVNTIEGQRLLRSSNTPDLEEVSDWIHWARHARTLRAA